MKSVLETGKLDADIAGRRRQGGRRQCHLGVAAATALIQINTPARNRATVRHVVDPRARPGDPAPATGHYEELNVFGSHTGQDRSRHGRRAAACRTAWLHMAPGHAGGMLTAPI